METIWILVAFAAGLGVSRIGLPPLVGYLFAGFALHYFGVQPLAQLDSLADLGISLLLFCIGLKLDIKQLFKKETIISTTGHMMLFGGVTFAVLFAVKAVAHAYFADIESTTILLIAFALSFSSTICVVKMLEDKGELKTKHGQICLTVLVLQDVIAVLYLTLSAGSKMSWLTALVLVLPLLTPLLKRIVTYSGHNELLPLAGFGLALGGGALFELIGLKAALGSLFFGILLSSHVKATELNKSLMAFKDLFLIGFFLSIGFTALPTLETLLIALGLTLLLPIKAALFFVILLALGFRGRTSLLSSLALTNFSEFGLIVANIAFAQELISADWMIILALSVSISFILASILNPLVHGIYSKYKVYWTKWEKQSITMSQANKEQSDTDVLIMGMGRVGVGAYNTLSTETNFTVCGIDASEKTINKLKAENKNVLLGDGEDSDFWESLALKNTKLIMLALPTLQDLTESMRQLKEAGYQGSVVAVAKYEDERRQLEECGIDAVYNYYNEAGSGFARHAFEKLPHITSVSN
jgi:predicted Kef-type K+ transport protein